MMSKKLFKKLAVPLAFVVIIAAGCSKTDSILGPNGNNNQVSFAISQQAGYYGGTQFLFKPAADVKISRIISTLAAQQFADTTRFNNINYVYSKDTTYIINEFTGIQNGQQWSFNFTGSGTNNSNYSVSINYTAH